MHHNSELLRGEEATTIARFLGGMFSNPVFLSVILMSFPQSTLSPESIFGPENPGRTENEQSSSTLRGTDYELPQIERDSLAPIDLKQIAIDQV